MKYLQAYENNCKINDLLNAKDEYLSATFKGANKKYLELLDNLPDIKAEYLSLEDNEIVIGNPSEISQEKLQIIQDICTKLIPWKKGPFKLFGLEIDAEWRSDQKWNRLKNKLGPLENKTILDIGCNNGYYMFKMAQDNPKLVLGIDPVIRCQTQFQLIQHFARVSNLHFEPLGVEHVKYFTDMFDIIFSMGIIYHHRNPILQLQEIHQALRPGGEIILETIGIPGEEPITLFPEDRYAKMRNVWFIPTVTTAINWLKKTKFIDIEVISNSVLTSDEQRLTKWCPPPHQSLSDFLHPEDPSLTIEGYPAPIRFSIKAKKRN